MVMSEQRKDLLNRYIKHVLVHRGSYTDLFEIELFQIIERIMSHLPPPHQSHHVTLNEHIILCKKKIMSEQKKDLLNRFIKHLLGHVGSYTYFFEIELVQITEEIM